MVDLNCIPQHLHKLIGQNRYGSNCWNATIIFLDEKESVGYTEQSDMERWLRINSFRVPSDEVEVGDILVMRDGFDLVHTATLVKIENGERYFWHKPGIGYGWKIDPYKTIQEIYSEYINGLYWHRVGAVISKVG